MEFLLFSIGAVLLMAAGAMLSGGWSPRLPKPKTTACDSPRGDEFGEDLMAMLGYQGARTKEDEDEA